MQSTEILKDDRTNSQTQTGRREQGETVWFRGKSIGKGHESNLILHLEEKDLTPDLPASGSLGSREQMHSNLLRNGFTLRTV